MTRDEQILLSALNRSLLKWTVGILSSLAIAFYAIGGKVANAQRDVTELKAAVSAVAPLGRQVDSLRFELRALTNALERTEKIPRDRTVGR